MSEIFASAEFWVAVAFVIFVGVLLKFGWNRVLTALDKRASDIKTELDQAVRLREEAQELLAGYQRKQRDAEKEAADIIAHAATEADRIRAEAREELAAAVDRRTEAAMAKIAQAEAQALAEVRDTAVEVAVSAARTMLTNNLDEPRSNVLIDDAIGELRRKLH
ncbi:MAG: F0F1 ATP synthase subunit B [Proteobacteria bacterium]|nr:F0F1 ATP synthase subunit B [Pseudomonadota bacterium]